MAEFKDHFSTASAGYAAHRPTYPRALGEWIASEAPGRSRAWDAGCGSGQLSTLLGDQFERVIATDASAEQIRNATQHAQVEYRVEPAEQTTIADDTVDCVTVAQAAHWIDLDRFYAETRRVARDAALIVLVTYERAHVDPVVDQVVQEFYGVDLDSFWPIERRHVETAYKDLAFPCDRRAVPMFDMSADWNVDSMLGYVETWSAVRALLRAGQEKKLVRFREELRGAWGGERRTVRWPVTVIAGRVEH
jgi:SAM-dependent methyltransferase